MLKWLSGALYKKYNTRVFILINDYHMPLNQALKHGFYKDASAFLRSFYGLGLKDNSALEKACIIGVEKACIMDVNEVRPELSGFNNYTVYSTAMAEYSEYFGGMSNRLLNHVNTIRLF